MRSWISVSVIVACIAVLLTRGSAAQILPQNPAAIAPPLGALPGDVIGAVQSDAQAAQRTIAELAQNRVNELRALVSQSKGQLEMTTLGPAVRGEIIAVEPDSTTLAAAVAMGMTINAEEEVAGLGLRAVTFSIPAGASLDRSLKLLRRAAPAASLTANHIYTRAAKAGKAPPPVLLQRGDAKGGIGMIDGGVAAHPAFLGPVEQRGFVTASPSASAHGTAVASLITSSGIIKSPAPGAPLLVADVYGADKAGGNALAIARALGWLIERKAPVIAMSLVGPPNVLLERAISAAQGRGILIVAAVGNDGAASPPSYPASYPGVIAVTAVDARNRVLIEAGHSLHVDFAAPGADMVAASLSGGAAKVRGTSFAVPLVAALAWRAAKGGSPDPRATLIKLAVDLGKPGADAVFGNGLLCGMCRTTSAK